MDNYKITKENISAFEQHLHIEERTLGTISKYLRDVTAFSKWLNGRAITKDLAAEWKSCLCNEGLAPITVNSMLAAMHSFFRFIGCPEYRVKYLKIQRRLFRDSTKDLSRNEYELLVDTARSLGRLRLALLLETMAGTGIRVSELRYVTVEALQQGCAEISLKGKIRTILFPNKLARKLLKYAQKNKIASGEIFLTGSGKFLTRHQIWAEMKRLCRHTGIDARKVFPHNIRHLFAVTFYKACKDIVKVANVLGHSSIETTRIYLLTTNTEHVRQLDRLGLVS